jgi:hypothetical protein
MNPELFSDVDKQLLEAYHDHLYVVLQLPPVRHLFIERGTPTLVQHRCALHNCTVGLVGHPYVLSVYPSVYNTYSGSTGPGTLDSPEYKVSHRLTRPLVRLFPPALLRIYRPLYKYCLSRPSLAIDQEYCLSSRLERA